MGLFQNIISSVGNGISDVFGGGDSNDQPKRKQTTPNAPTVNNNLTASKISLPKPLVSAPRPVTPVAPPTVANTANLTVQPFTENTGVVGNGETYQSPSNLRVVQSVANPAGANAWAGISQNTPDFLHNIINAAEQQRGKEASASLPPPAPNFRGALPPAMVNVSWSNTPVPYADSLNGPPENGVKPSATPQQDLFHSLLGHVVNAVNSNVVQPVKQQVQGVENAVSDIPVIGKPLVSADKGIGLGIVRAGEGFVQAVPATANAVVHGVNEVPRLIAGNNSAIGQAADATNQQAQNATNIVSAPINDLAKATDVAASNSGRVGKDLYKPAQIATNVASVVPGAADLATRLPVIGDNIAAGLSKLPVIGGRFEKVASEAVGGVDASRVADETAPTATENTPPESGTKTPGETKPTNAPAGETAPPTPAPGAPEAGVKPVEPPNPAPSGIMDKIAALPTAETPPVTPPEAAPTPPAVAAEQAAAQNAVDKTAENVPKPTPPPETAAPAIAPAQAASDALAAKEAPVQQVVANESVNNEPAYLRRSREVAAQAKATADTAAAEKAAAPEIDKIPTFQHNQNIKAVIEDGNNQLNDWAEAHPNATPAQIQEAKDSITKQVTDKVNELQKARHGVAPAEPTPEPPERQSAPAPPVDANDLNTPAYQRTSAKADQAAKEAADKEAEAEKLAPATEVDKTPAFQHQQNLKDVIAKGNDELNEFVEAHPDATPQEIDAAKQAITSQVTSTIQKLQDARYGGTAEEASRATGLPEDTASVTFKKTENPLKGETPPENPYGINPVEGLSDETAAQGGTKAQLSEGDKILSPKAQLSKVGAAGRQLLQLFRNKEFNEGRLTTAMENETPTFNKLSAKDQATAAKVVRGEVTTDNANINTAAQELQDHFKNVLQSARSAGIDAGDLGKTYIPQMKEAGYFNKASNIKKLIKTLVGKGYSEEDATQTVNRLRNDVRSRPNLAGHLELPREVEAPDQNFNSAKLRAYNEQAASRIAEAQHYGANNEEITKLHGKAAENGEDVNQIRQITEDYMHPKAVSKGALSKLATGVRGVTNVALLPKAALSHTFQGLQNTASDVGFVKYFKALGNKVFSSDERDFIGKSGIKNINTEERSVLDKATAPGLKQLRSFHQKVAVLAGKYHADALAAKGDEAGLRKIGVTGDLTKGSDGKISLTETQQLQAGKVESDKSIFSDSSLETSKALRGNLGKAVGQFRTAYVAKQGGRIIDLVKQARHGDVAPLLRYLAVGVPVGGTGTLALKNLYKTGNPNPFPSGTSVKSDVLNVAQNSGIESPGFGLPESAVNAVRYNYNNNDRVNNAAGVVSPIAGIATEAGQNIDQALRGNNKPLIKQGASYIPLPLVGKYIDKRFAPTKPITPDEQKFFNAYGPALQKLNNTVNPFSKSATNQNTRVTDDIKSLTSNDHNAQGQSIQKSPAETQAQWTTIAGLPPNAQNAYVDFQKSLPNHSVAYDLTGNGTVIDKSGNQSPASKFQVYANYEKELPGSAECSQLESLNPWLSKTFQAEQAQFNSSKYKSTSVPYNGPLPGGVTLKDLQYPTISPATNDLMNQATQLSSIPAASRTSEQETELKNIESDPDLQAAYTSLDNYTNAQRVARGAPPLKLLPNASPAVQAGINAYDALPASKSGGNTDPATSGERSAWILAHPALYAQMQDYYASADMGTIASQGAKDELQGNAPSQSFLSAIKGEGADILSTKNANGTTSYSINPAAADAAAYGSGSSASAKAYEADKAAGLSDNGEKYSTKAKVTGLKADTKKYTPPKLLADTAPTGKNGNPFVQAISDTKGVKIGKGSNIFGHAISDVKKVKAA